MNCLEKSFKKLRVSIFQTDRSACWSHGLSAPKECEGRSQKAKGLPVGNVPVKSSEECISMMLINLNGEHVQSGLGVLHCSADKLLRLSIITMIIMYDDQNDDDDDDKDDDNSDEDELMCKLTLRSLPVAVTRPRSYFTRVSRLAT